MSIATAIAHPNIALCKYWGKRDRALNLPTNGSLSLTLAPFLTTTTVRWGVEADSVALNGAPAEANEARKVLAVLDLLAPGRPAVAIDTSNNFPTAAGLASSASGFAALVVAANAASAATGWTATESRLPRATTGMSACSSRWSKPGRKRSAPRRA